MYIWHFVSFINCANYNTTLFICPRLNRCLILKGPSWPTSFQFIFGLFIKLARNKFGKLSIQYPLLGLKPMTCRQGFNYCCYSNLYRKYYIIFRYWKHVGKDIGRDLSYGSTYGVTSDRRSINVCHNQLIIIVKPGHQFILFTFKVNIYFVQV